jgi:signal transduction histidine kinase/CheY-like chemotaxis protein
MPAQAFIQYAVYVTQAAFGLLLAVSFAVLTRVYDRHFMRLWSWAWAFEAVHVIGGLLSLLVRGPSVGAMNAASVIITFLAQFAGLASGYLLLLGAVSIRREATERVSTCAFGVMVCGVLALCTTFLGPTGLDPDARAFRFFLRVGVVQGIAAACTVATGVLLWQSARERASGAAGLRWSGIAALALGVHRVQYLVISLIAVFGETGAVTQTYYSLLPLVEVVLVAALGIGAGIAMVEEARGSLASATKRQLAAERAARASGASMVSALAAIPDLVAVVDTTASLLAWNPAFEALCASRGGAPPRAQLGLDDVLPALVDGDRWAAHLPQVLLGRNHEFTCTVAADARGPARAFDGSVRPIRDGGTVVGAVLVARDITERQAMEQQLQQAQRLDTVGRLAGGIAHDFNNLLTAILSSTAMARDVLPPDHEALADLQDIQLASERASGLTRQLLAFARRQPVAQEPVRIAAHLSSLERMLSRLAGPSVRLTFASDDDVWPVRVDVPQLEQVVVNLVVNARDAMPDGGSVDVTVCNRVVRDDALRRRDVPNGEYVEVSVQDTGVGIDAETLSHVFEPFFTTKPVGQGTGLGLAMCYGIMRQHRGHVWIESEVGQGTRVVLLLPRHRGAVEPRPIEATLPANVEQALTGAERILLVEDEPQVRTVAARVLRQAGYRVLEATNGRDGVQLARRERGRIDLIVTDVVMPEMGGREMVDLVRVFIPGAAVLFVSGYTAGALSTPTDPAPDAAFLQKPFAPTELLAAVRARLDQGRVASAASEQSA